MKKRKKQIEKERENDKSIFEIKKCRYTVSRGKERSLA